MAYQPEATRYATMQYKRCGRSGLKLPLICLGLWHNFGGVNRLENGRAMIHRAFDLGITHFDLAQGLLTNKYLHGIPEDSRVKRSGIFLNETHVTDKVIEKVRRLRQIAQNRGQSMAQMAVAWVLRQPVVTSALLGASRPAQIEEIVGALDNLHLTTDELERIDSILNG